MKTLSPCFRVCFRTLGLNVVLLAFSAALGLAAQTPLTAMTAAVRLRSDTALAVVKGEETAAGAIARLKAHESPSGLKGDRDADVGFAIMDVGQRLIATGRSSAAEEFFKEAEKSLELALKKIPDTEAGNQAMLLQNLAFIRGNYLNKAVQAREDIDAAIKLQPDDKYLRVFRDSLAKDKADIFREKSKN